MAYDVEEPDRNSLERALAFYEQYPTGQWDDEACWAIQYALTSRSEVSRLTQWRASAEAAGNEAMAERDSLREKLKVAREALAYYAEEITPEYEIWVNGKYLTKAASLNVKARAALAQIEGEE